MGVVSHDVILGIPQVNSLTSSFNDNDVLKINELAVPVLPVTVEYHGFSRA